MIDPGQRTDGMTERGNGMGALTVHDRFRDIAAQNPDRVALVTSHEDVTYAALAKRVTSIASGLCARGVGGGGTVGVALERGPELIAGMLGVLSAGASYVPLDLAQPDERLERILLDAGPAIVLSERSRTRQFAAFDAPSLAVEECTDPSGEGPGRGDVSDDARAYVMYTSGSTGTPKGVEIAHTGVLCLTDAINECFFRQHSITRVMQFAPVSFDSSVAEIFPTLLTGRTLVLPPRDPSELGPEELLAVAAHHGVDMLTLPPSYLMETPMDAEIRLPRVLIVAGERCPRELVARWAAHTALYNGYGPTEVTVAASYGRLGLDDQDDVPLGRPLKHLRHAVLRNESLVSRGERGELFLAGASLALGYLNDPDLTAQRFRVITLPGERPMRMYSTGDLVEERDDGQLLFRGRADHQVKLRGQRIELEDVERALLSAVGVIEAVVLAVGNEDTVDRLVAFVRSEGELDAADLQAHVRSLRPSAYVPSEVVFVDDWPVTRQGKIDRDALLSSLGDARGGSSDSSDPIAQVWCEVLGRDEISPEDDFFLLGGHSVLAMRVVALIRRRLSVRVPARMLFENSRLDDFSAAVESVRGGPGRGANAVEVS